MTVINLPARRTPAALVLQPPTRSDAPLRVAIVGAAFAALTVMGAIAGRPWVMWLNAALTVLALIGLGVALTSANSRRQR